VNNEELIKFWTPYTSGCGSKCVFKDSSTLREGIFKLISLEKELIRASWKSYHRRVSHEILEVIRARFAFAEVSALSECSCLYSLCHLHCGYLLSLTVTESVCGA